MFRIFTEWAKMILQWLRNEKLEQPGSFRYIKKQSIKISLPTQKIKNLHCESCEDLERESFEGQCSDCYWLYPVWWSCLRLSILYSSNSVDWILELYDKQSRRPRLRKEVSSGKQYQ